ncbi:hypothetical protein MVEN_00111800 [Mycena venus]|uniref:Uncharacterized protein n=1 Tax=Mycena venus TaxID=2733690 RepID=A0A8H6ZB81_9AGAR|nr:hypothetical protein MVEN_00111800 [Mycena venus]
MSSVESVSMRSSSSLFPKVGLLALSFWISVVFALPVSILSEATNSLTCEDVHTCRTLSNVIWSCITTIFACIWTAIHRNIPGPNQSRFHSLVEKGKIILVTLLVPEWVLAWAVRQRIRAEDVGLALERARNDAKALWAQHEKNLLPDGSPISHVNAIQSAGIFDDLVTEREKGRLSDPYTSVHGFFVIMDGFHLYIGGQTFLSSAE